MARRLVRTVRLVGWDIAVVFGWHRRSITESQSTSSGTSSSPTDPPNAPSFDAANKNALARVGLVGQAARTSSLAKPATSADSVRWLNRSITSATPTGCTP